MSIKAVNSTFCHTTHFLPLRQNNSFLLACLYVLEVLNRFHWQLFNQSLCKVSCMVLNPFFYSGKKWCCKILPYAKVKKQDCSLAITTFLPTLSKCSSLSFVMWQFRGLIAADALRRQRPHVGWKSHFVINCLDIGCF